MAIRNGLVRIGGSGPTQREIAQMEIGTAKMEGGVQSRCEECEQAVKLHGKLEWDGSKVWKSAAKTGTARERDQAKRLLRVSFNTLPRSPQQFHQTWTSLSLLAIARMMHHCKA